MPKNKQKKGGNSERGKQRKGARLMFVFTLTSLVGCNASLPEPESLAARLYQQRCSGCHRLYAPSLLTSDMWRFMLGRMEMEMQRRGMPLPTPEERATLLEYLQKHASNASQQPAFSDQQSVKKVVSIQ
jgi:hypothetical protein